MTARLRPRHATPTTVALSLIAAWLGAVAAAEPTPSPAPTCPDETLRALLAPASHPNEAFPLQCSPTLRARDVVTKRIALVGEAASGVVIDCRDGRIGRPEAQPPFPNPTIEIRSRMVTASPPRWVRPTGIVVRNCTVDGPIRIWGMGINGQAEELRRSSTSLGHTERAQEAAPSRILIENVTLRAHGQTPLYVGPGVTEVTLRGSRIRGTAPAIGIYLDAESARNTIAENEFDVGTGREVVAIDGSAHNVVVGNTFRIGWRGGIYLYRNCGEGGTVRHQTPSHNRITGNRFVYGSPVHLPAIHVGSRNGWSWYCHKDDGYPFGSSIDDGDNATDNVVTSNVVE